MKHLLLLFFFMCSLSVMSQDVIIHVTGQCSKAITPMDTIIIENLSNPDTITFGPLPQEVSTYDINLSKGILINGISEELINKRIGMVVNKPGQQILQVYLTKDEPLRVSVFNMQGSMVVDRCFNPGAGTSLMEIKGGAAVLYVVKVTGRQWPASFKMTGDGLCDGPPTLTLLNHCDKTGIKSAAQEPFSGDFIFNPGDEIRITGRKTGYYTNTSRGYPDNEDSIPVYLSKPCPGVAVVTDIDGNTYQTVQIGTQCWMRENMKCKHYADGTPLVDGTGVGCFSNDDTTKYWFDYNDDPSISAEYGRLYSGAAAINGSPQPYGDSIRVQGLCPNGWHLADHPEWKTVEIYLGMQQLLADFGDYRGTDEGNQIKEADEFHWWFPWGKNNSGFTALGAGIKYDQGEYDMLQALSAFWTSTAMQEYPEKLLTRTLMAVESRIALGHDNKSLGFSCRCIKD